MVGHQIRLRGDDNFYLLAGKKRKKRTRNLLVAYVGVYIFVLNDGK